MIEFSVRETKNLFIARDTERHSSITIQSQDILHRTTY